MPLLATGEVGQVTIGGSRPPRAYLGDADGVRRRTWVDGWLPERGPRLSGQDGHLWIVGRAKEIIIRGGHNVVPGEVEAALFEHPAVAEAAVTGVAHPVLGEDVAAWVVLRRHVRPRTCSAFLARAWPTTRCPAGLPWSTRSRGTRAARSSNPTSCLESIRSAT